MAATRIPFDRPPLRARGPTGWNHLVEKSPRKIISLSMIFPQRLFLLLRIMLLGVRPRESGLFTPYDLRPMIAVP